MSDLMPWEIGEDTLECGEPERVWDAMAKSLRSRANMARQTAAELHRTAQDALQGSDEFAQAAIDFDALASALEKAPVAFALAAAARQAPKADKLRELAERCEAATDSNQHIVIMAAMDAVARLTRNDAKWEEAIRFHKAGAYLDAAMTLVPEGQVVLLTNTGIELPQADFSRSSAMVGPPDDTEARPVQAATMALALCAATLRARAAQ